MAARTLIVGDVHGCIDELERLLEAVGMTRDDRLVMVGDLVAKGPESVAVLRLLQELKAESVLGNHDAHLLRVRRARLAGQPVPDVSDAVKKVARKLDEEDWAWLEALPYTISIPKHGSLVVHGGLVPGVPIERGLQRHRFATGLDTGCVYGGRLTGCVLPERDLVSVRAKRAYAEPGKTIAARHAGDKKGK
jgi:hypothetical protein